MRTVVYFATCSPEEIRRIRREYGIPPGMSVNGETECRLTEETLKGLQAEAERGLVQIRRKPDMPPPLPPPEKRRMPRRTMPQGQREEEKPRRAAQKIEWFKSLLEQEVLRRFYHKDGVQEMIDHYTGLISRSEITAAKAVKNLMSAQEK